MLQPTDCRLETVSAHQIGNIHHGEELLLSVSPLDISDPELKEILIRYFLGHFSEPEFFSFNLNEPEGGEPVVYQYAKQIFNEEPVGFHEFSRKIATHLFEQSGHPNIKSGDLYVALLRDVIVEDELADAIAIFKSETKQPFLKLLSGNSHLSLQYDHGVYVDKLDKACLIFNLSESGGYKVCVVDKVSRGEEAQFWKQKFLGLTPCADSYHYTQSFMKATKKFVNSKELDEHFQVEKADKIDYLNASVQYFRNNEDFDETEYASEVFRDDAIAQAFQGFQRSYQEESSLPPAETFEISEQAVKKQARGMRSVLKLDKNFHVYIHGDKRLIEKGYDEEVGKSYYKIYFDEES